MHMHFRDIEIVTTSYNLSYVKYLMCFIKPYLAHPAKVFHPLDMTKKTCLARKDNTCIH